MVCNTALKARKGWKLIYIFGESVIKNHFFKQICLKNCFDTALLLNSKKTILKPFFDKDQKCFCQSSLAHFLIPHRGHSVCSIMRLSLLRVVEYYVYDYCSYQPIFTESHHKTCASCSYISYGTVSKRFSKPFWYLVGSDGLAKHLFLFVIFRNNGFFGR